MPINLDHDNMKLIPAILPCLSLWLWSVSVLSAELRCANNGVVIDGANDNDVEDGCSAVESAARFLASAGLPIPQNIIIHLVDQPAASPLTQYEMGRYDPARRAIHVLGFQSAVAATRGNESGLGRVDTRPHWRSYVAHEFAHAAVHLGCDSTCPSRAIHEYIAGVAQLSAFPREERDQMLAHYRDLAPFEKSGEISEIYYAINPHYFAVKSYKHYQRLPDPQGFVKQALGWSD